MTTATYLHHETQTIDTLATLEAVGDIPPGSLMLLVADADGRLIMPLGVDDVPEDPPQHARITTLRHTVEALAQIKQCGGLLLAIGRLGDPKPRGSDFGWHDALAQAVEGSTLVAYGTYVVTPSGVRRVRPQLGTPSP